MAHALLMNVSDGSCELVHVQLRAQNRNELIGLGVVAEGAVNGLGDELNRDKQTAIVSIRSLRQLLKRLMQLSVRPALLSPP